MKSPIYSVAPCKINFFVIIINIILHFSITVVAFQSLIELPKSEFSIIKSPRIRKVRVLNVNDFGAVGDGLHDDTEAIRNAWKLACSSSRRSLIVIPEGFSYLVRPIDFAKCKSQVTLKLLGAIVAPKDPEVWIGWNSRKWLYFHNVNHLTLEGGGTINGMGEKWWAVSCKVNATIPCHHAPTAVTFHRCKGLKVRDISIIDSQQTHLTFTNCHGIVVSKLTITAPPESPNTDGIHISASIDVQVRDTIIRTGDDCISIVSNSSTVLITSVLCGAGHGISIGSLGKSNERSEVHNVMVDGVHLSDTKNGVRIKTWQGGVGFASRITFKNILMENVSNPIIIDQFYCDSRKPCKNQTSAVHVENISFMNIKGISASEEAIRFACSDSVPCRGLYLKDIQLVTYTGVVTSFCWNAQGSSSGIVIPSSCFPIQEEQVIASKISSISLFSS